MMTLSAEERRRYARHLAIPGFGTAGQERLKKSSVLVVGAGGLGSPLLLYLTAAGIGRIGVVDFDRVESSNLQRQVLYTEEDTGQPKATIAAERLRKLNPHVEIIPHVDRLSSVNARAVIRPYDIVADGSDNFPTRYLVNDACLLENKPLVYGSIYRFEGQVAVFNYPLEDGTRSPNYRDLFPEPPPPELVPNCAEGGVIGVLPGIIGSLQANEVIKIASGVGAPLIGKLYLFDATTLLSRSIKILHRNDYKVTELIDYEQFCNPAIKEPVPEISVSQLAEWKADHQSFQLIDVRQPHERELSHIGGLLIPLRQLSESIGKIDRQKEIVVYCRSGRRSAQAVRLLKNEGYDKVHSLKGGLLEWSRQIDDTIIV